MTEYPHGAEAVAYALMRDIAKAEGAALDGAVQSWDRQRILDTYAECLRYVRAEAVKAAPTHGRSSF